MFLGGRPRRVRERDVPSDDARLLQGAALHGGRHRHPRARRRTGHPQDGRLAQVDAANVSSRSRSARSRWSGIPPFAGFFSKDSDPRRRDGPRRLRLRPLGRRSRGDVPDRASTRSGCSSSSSGASRARSCGSTSMRPKRDVVGLTMGVPVAVLAVLSVIGGWIQFAPFWHPVDTWLQSVAEPVVTPTDWQEGISSALARVARARRDLRRLGSSTRARRSPCRASPSRSACSSTSSISTSCTTRCSTAPPSGSRRRSTGGVEDPLIAESSTSLGQDTRDLGGIVARAPDGPAAHLRARNRLERRRSRHRLQSRSR